MKTLHLISHTHWDREWHQTFQQFRLRLVHLVDNLLDILAQDEQYLHFMLDGQTIVLEDYLQLRPEREEELRRHVQSGRVLIGPWYILPDEFLVSPEATVRNLLEGGRGAARFGPKMRVGYIPDPFGHIGQMPQILRGFGIADACLWRGVAGQANEFWWQGPDGSRVLMGFLQQGYMNAAGILNGGQEGFVREANRLRDELAANTAGTDLVLMNGVDHQEASPGTPAALAYAAGKLQGDEMLHSTLPAYFAAVRRKMELEKLAVVEGELRAAQNAPLLPGVLSARMWIKQRNRACEALLERWAGPFSAWAQTYAAGQFPAEGLRDPRGALREAWRLLMQCHPHDSICGCSIDQVHEEMRPRFDQAEQIGEAITSQSLEALAKATQTLAPVRLPAGQIASAVVVFNPGPRARTDLVSAELKVLPEGGSFELVDENGEALPYETLGVGSGVLYDMIVDRASFAGMVKMVAPGEGPAGLRILGLTLERGSNPEEVSITVRTGATGEPDLQAWEASSREVNALLADERIKNYRLMVAGDPSSQVRFVAREVPGLGYRTFWVRAREAKRPEPARLSPLAKALMPLAARLAASPALQGLASRMVPDPATKPPYRIENEFLRVEAQADGSLDVLDKRSGLLYRGQNRLIDGGDRGDSYNYSRPEIDPSAQARLLGARVIQGSVQQALELRLELSVPEGLSPDRKARSAKLVKLPVTARVTLCAGLERVEIHTEVENFARDHRLRVHFAAPFVVDSAKFDGHYEILRRGLALPAYDESWAEQPRPEMPQRAFTLVSDGQNGLLIANRGLPEVEVINYRGGSEIALTLLRCVGWLSRGDFPERKGPAGPEIETPGAQMAGKWSFDYAILPFGSGGRGRAIQQAAAFEAPLRAAGTPLHPGELPPQASFLAIEPEAFLYSTVKAAEDGPGWVARGYHPGGGEPLAVKMRPLRPARAQRTTLSEEGGEDLQLNSAGEVELQAKPYEVVTLRFDPPSP